LSKDILLVTGKTEPDGWAIYAVNTVDRSVIEQVVTPARAGEAPHQPVITDDRNEFLYLIGDGGGPGIPYVETFGSSDPATPFYADDRTCKFTYRPAFSADNSLATVCGKKRSKLTKLRVFDADGQFVRTIVTPGQPVGDPTWNGDNIIFLELDGEHKRIVSINQDGDEATRQVLDEGPASRPDWCEDGGLLFLRTSAGTPEFGTITIRSGPRLKTVESLTDLGSDVESATWSPDCTKIAFSVRPAAGEATSSLFIANADGSDPQEVDLGDGVSANQAAWGSR